MKVVINKCYGGFGLSPLAIQRLAELNNRECYFYESHYKGKSITYKPISIEQADEAFLSVAFDIPDISERKFDHDNNYYAEHSLYDYNYTNRNDPLLVQVVEELGNAASSKYAKLKIVEIPDNVDFEICEYDGMEHIAEKHRTWC